MEYRKVIHRFALLIIGAGLSSCASDKKPALSSGAAQEPSKWGYYSGSPVTRWEPDGRTMTLLSELRYTDPQGFTWIAPSGSQVDGASIPIALVDHGRAL